MKTEPITEPIKQISCGALVMIGVMCAAITAVAFGLIAAWNIQIRHDVQEILRQQQTQVEVFQITPNNRSDNNGRLATSSSRS